MKVLLFSSISALLLTGCDNFQLLKPLAEDSAQEFNIPAETLSPESTGPDQGSQERGTSRPPTIVIQPAIPEENSTSPSSAPTPENEVSAPIATPQPPEKEETQPAPAQAPATPAKEKPVVEAPVRSTEKAEVPVAAQAVSEKPTTSPAPAATSSKSESTDSIVTIVEYINLTNVLNQTFGTEKNVAMAAVLPADAKKTDIKIVSAGGIDKLTHQVFNKDKLVVEAVDVRLALNGKTLIPLNGYNLHAMCSGAQCNILFVTVTKSDATKKIVENYPIFLKLVNGKYLQASFKKQEEYAADRNALTDPNKIKLVPQLVVTQKLDEHMKAHSAQLIFQLLSKLKSDEKLAYTDNLIGAVGTKALIPQFFRHEGKLYVQAKLELPAPRRALEFKSEVKSDEVSETSRTDQGLSMTVFPRVKDQIYMLLFEQEKYKSKIANVEGAAQVMNCSIVEEENNIFSTCETLKSEVVFSEKDVIEGSVKGTIKK